MPIQFVILKSESDRNFELWQQAIVAVAPESLVHVKDAFLDCDWKDICAMDGGILLATASGRSQWLKRVYDEKIWALAHHPNWLIYPPMEEIFLYENKKLLRDWMLIQGIPHPKTYVFFQRKEAENYSNSTAYPVVVKTNIGASGSGVRIIEDQKEYLSYCANAFGVGVQYKSGPKWFKGSILKKLGKIIANPGFIKQRMKEYKISKAEIQRDMVFVQEFIPHEFEWRCVIIGKSFFAHKKLAVNNMSSGTLLKGYDEVPAELLNFLQQTMVKTGLVSACIDVFEIKEGFLVNEIQTFFGQSDPYQMLVNGKPGRYVCEDSSWTFEPGDFNRLESYELRLQHALQLWKQKN